MSRLTSQWKPLLGITIVAGIAIFIFEPGYNNLQTAGDADAFRALLGDHQGRATAAAFCDIVFAAAYGLLAVIAFRALGHGRTALVGAVVGAGAAVADEIENVLVLINVRHAASVADGRIDAMTSIGTVKWALLAIAFMLALVLLVRRMREAKTA